MADAIPDPRSIAHVLMRAGIPRRRQPAWGAVDPEVYWSEVSELIGNGICEGGRTALLDAAREWCRGNPVFIRDLDPGVLSPAERQAPSPVTGPKTGEEVVSGDPENPEHWPAYQRLADQYRTDRARCLARAEEATRVRANLLRTSAYLREAGQYEAARNMADDLYTCLSSVLGVEHTDTLAAAQHLAGALQSLARYVPAHDLNRLILDSRRRMHGERDQETLTAAANLGVNLLGLRRHDEARNMIVGTLESRTRHLGPHHRDTLISMLNLAGYHRATGNYVIARELDAKAMDLAHAHLGTHHPLALSAAASLGEDLLRLAAAENAASLVIARSLLDSNLRGRREILGPEHPATLESARLLVVPLFELGEIEEARRLAEDTLEKCVRVLGATARETLQLERNLTRIRRA